MGSQRTDRPIDIFPPRRPQRGTVQDLSVNDIIAENKEQGKRCAQRDPSGAHGEVG